MKDEKVTQNPRHHKMTHCGVDAENYAKMISSFGHELRTPLNLIIGYTGTMLMQLSGPVNDDQKEQLDIIKQSAHSLLSMIDNMMELSRIRSGTYVPVIEKVNAKKLADEISTEYSSMKTNDSVTFSVVSPDDTYVWCDKRLLKSILAKLIKNAFQSTNKGSIEVRFIQAEKSSDMIDKISVTDTGIGIKEDFLCELFSYPRSANKDVTHHDSLGIGLVICSDLAHEMHAAIECESEYGKGSRFSIMLHHQNG